MSIKPTTVIQRSSPRSLRLPASGEIYDLLLLLGIACLIPGMMILQFSLVRVPLGLATVLFAPGYALVAALFPRHGQLDGVARAGLSFGLSVAVVPLLAWVVNALPWGLRPWPTAISLMLWLAFWASIALVRRARLPADVADMAPEIDIVGWWGGLARPMRLRYLLGSVAIVLVLASGAYALVAPDPSARLTEFYALGAEGLAESYPREVAPGQSMQVQLGIVNREGILGRYRVEARSAGQVLAQAGPIELADGGSWQAPLSYALPQAGADQQVDILLFRDGALDPYRQLRLWVNVVESTTK